MAVDQITWDFFNKIKDRLQDVGGKIAQNALENARKNLIGFSEVSADGEVA